MKRKAPGCVSSIFPCETETYKNIIFLFLPNYIVVIYVCPIITQEPLDRFPSNFEWGAIGRTAEMFLAWFQNSKLSRSTFTGKNSYKRNLQESVVKRWYTNMNTQGNAGFPYYKVTNT